MIRSVYIPWICFLHSVRYQGKRKTKPYSVFPITAFNTKCDVRFMNLFLYSFRRTKCGKQFILRFPHLYPFWKTRKTINGKRPHVVSFSVFTTCDLPSPWRSGANPQCVGSGCHPRNFLKFTDDRQSDRQLDGFAIALAKRNIRHFWLKCRSRW